MQEYNRIYLPTPSNFSEGYDSKVFCTQHSGYTYYLQAQFVLLCLIVLFQVGWACLHGRAAIP